MSIYAVNNDFMPIKEKVGVIHNYSAYTVEYAVTAGSTPEEGSGVKVYPKGSKQFDIASKMNPIIVGKQGVASKVLWLRIFADDGVSANITVDCLQHDSSVKYDISGISKWGNNVHYVVDQLVLYENELCRCTTEHTSTTTFNEDYWSVMNYDVGYSEIKDAIEELGQLDESVEAAANSAEQALAHANTASEKVTEIQGEVTKASEFASAASESATLASTYADNAKASEEASKASEGNSAKSATAASESAALAGTKASEAGASAVNAKASEDKAAEYLGDIKGMDIDQIKEYALNAKTWSEAANTKAGEAASSATKASESAQTASTKATESTNSATDAQTYAANAKASEDKAAEYLGDIKGIDIEEIKKYATDAKSSSETATTKATEASDSAAAAKESEEKAKTYLASAYRYQGSVATYLDLPSNPAQGDVYNVETADATHSIKAGDNVAWNGSEWDNFAGFVDISGKADKASTLSGYGITDAKIENGVITLGSNTFTPQTKLTDAQLANVNRTFATVATSGSYNDLTDKPTIPEGTITGVTMNGESKGTSGVVDLGNVVTEQYELPTATADTLGGVKASYGDTDLTAGTSELATGSYYFYYE